MKRIFWILFCGFFMFGFSAQAAKGKNEDLKPKLLIEPESYDFGSILSETLPPRNWSSQTPERLSYDFPRFHWIRRFSIVWTATVPIS